MRKPFKVIGIIVILVVFWVGWQVSKDPSPTFTCVLLYKGIRGMLTGKHLSINKWGEGCYLIFEPDIFPDSVSLRRMDRLVEYLRKNMPCREIYGGLVVKKVGDRYEFHFPIKNGMENDAQTVRDMRVIAKDLSTNVFDSQPVDVHLSNEYFNTIRVVTQ